MKHSRLIVRGINRAAGPNLPAHIGSVVVCCEHCRAELVYTAADGFILDPGCVDTPEHVIPETVFHPHGGPLGPDDLDIANSFDGV